MRRRLACFAVLCAFAFAGGARAEMTIPTVDYPALPHHARSPEGFAPDGWEIEKMVVGDLNGDGVADAVLVLHDTDRKNVVKNDGMGADPFDTNPRILAVVFASKDGGYDLAVENHLLIPRPTLTNLEDYLSQSGGVEVKNGALRVSLYLFADAGGWDMGTTTYTFRWSPDGFRLIGYDNDDVQRNTGETTNVSINYSTGKMSTTTGHIESKASKVAWTKAPGGPPLTFERIGDGMAFDPQHPDTPGTPDQ
jgi:hypothetical protein